MLIHLATTLVGALSHLVAHLVSSVSPDHLSAVPHAAPFLFATAGAAIPGEATGADDADDDDAPAGESIADAGRGILKDLSDAEIAAQLKDDADDELEGADDDDADLEGRAAVDEVVDDTEGGAKPKAGAAGAKPDADTDPDAEPVIAKVILPGLAARGEEDIEIEIDDKDVADRLRRLKNEVIRARAETDRSAEVAEREAQLEAYQEQMEADPIGFHLNRLPVERQIEVARALILEHLDVLQPDIDRFIEDPVARKDEQLKLQKQIRKSEAGLTEARQVKIHAQKCVQAFTALIPEGTDEDVAAEFAADARSILAAAAKRGERVTPQTVPTILARRVKLYGFDKKPVGGKPAAPAKPVTDAAPRARPISDKAREIAGRKATTPDASSTQSRIRRTQAARNAASRIAPAGAGAAPVQTPALPPEAEQDIESMSRHLRKTKLPESWSVKD